MRKFYLLGILLCSLYPALSQVSTYTFSSSSGSYTPITGGTAISFGTPVNDASVPVAILDDEQYYNRPIGFSFVYNDVAYTHFGFSPNGWLVLGNSTSFGNSTTPISSSSAEPNAISAGAIDLGGVTKTEGSITSGGNVMTVSVGSTANINVGDSITGTGIPSPGAVVTAKTSNSITIDKTLTSTSSSTTWYTRNGEIRYETIGTAPNRVLVLQFKGFSRWSTTYDADVMNFQIRLAETSNTVSIVYGTWSATYTGTGGSLQVGLRGETNADYNNRTTTTNWASSTAGSSASSTMRFNATVNPASGLTFTWTPPSCSRPQSPGSSAHSSTSATVSWTAPANPPAMGYEYELRTSGAAGSGATGLVTSGSTAAGVVSANITGLTVGTSYSLYVRSKCGATEFSSWTPAHEFTTPCAPVATFSENFDGVTVPALPACWVQVGSTGTMKTQTANSSSAPNTFYIYSSSTSNIAMVALPAVSNAGAGTHWLRFKMRANITAGGVLEVGYLTNYADPASFVLIQAVTASSLTYQEYKVITGTAAGSNQHLALRHTGDPANSILIDDVSWELAPTCLPFAGVADSLRAATTTTIYWAASASNPSQGYEYEVRTSGAAGSGATGLVASGTTAAGVLSANISGLTASTSYTVYVRGNCGSGDFSAWTEGYTFTTTPANNECGDAISLTTTAYNASCTGYAATTVGASQSAGDPSCTSTANNDDVWFRFTATSTEHIIKFSGMTAVTGSATALGMDLYSGSCGSLTAVAGACDASFGSAGAGEMIVGGLTIGTEYRLRVWAAGTGNSATFNLCVMEPAAPTACVTSPSPANAATGVGLNPALSWTASALATNYDVYLGTVNPPTTLLGNTTTTSIQATGLSANTTYYWYVVSKNSAGGNSGCTVYSFTTAVNPPANDDCSGAITVTHGNYSAACTGTAFTTQEATKSTTASTYFATSHDDDLWYKFVAATDKMVIRFTSIAAASGTAGNMAYALYAGSDCGTFTDLGGNSVTITSGAGESALWYGLTVGNTYYVRIATAGTGFRATGNVCILVPDVAAGTANTCANAGSLTISAANSNNNRWMPLLIGSSIIGEINAQGNDLGAITGKVYVNSGALRREATSNRYYLDRNFEITPATQPTTPVKVRLYILGSELNAMMANPASGVTSLNSLNITKTDATCSGTYSGTGTFIVPDARVAYSGSNAYLEFTTSSFSSFYIHGGVGVLPVNLGEFTGEVKASANRLRWNTLTETNNSGFELQRSNDGNVFSAIGFIPTKADDGFSTTPLDYGFDDLKPLAGASYYRLKQVDRDGKYSYSKVVQLNRKAETLTISAIYPNPAVEELNLVIIAPAAEKANIIVTDLTGKVVAQQSLQLQQGSSRTSLRVASLSAGTYLVKVVCNNGCETAVKRFVKN